MLYLERYARVLFKEQYDACYSKKIIVDVPAETVWGILANPTRSTCLNPNMKPLYFFESKLGGYDSIAEYRMGGKVLQAKSCLVAYQPGCHLAYQTSGGLTSCWHWWLESDGRWTHVALTMGYDLPRALAGSDVALLEEQNGQMLEVLLANLKRLSEERRAA